MIHDNAGRESDIGGEHGGQQLPNHDFPECALDCRALQTLHSGSCVHHHSDPSQDQISEDGMHALAPYFVAVLPRLSSSR